MLPLSSDPSEPFAILHIELLLDWRQSADEVIVKLRVGAGPLRLEEVDAAFTDTDCVVRLPGVFLCPAYNVSFCVVWYPPPQVTVATVFPDGRQWGGVFFAEIQSSCTKVQARKGGLLQLALPKKVPLLTWPSLLVSSN